jgi:hypothetical protein
MYTSSEVKSARREEVLQACNSAEATNRRLFLEGDDKATAEYIFPNQKEDAAAIVNIFHETNCRVISIQKKTKVGADGLMIEIAKLLTTHSDDNFVVNPSNVRILTGMSNVGWETDMIDKAPICFKDKIFHHGKLSRSELTNIRDGLFIIDEIDTGDKTGMVLHNTLKEALIWDVNHMIEHNNRFVFISATMIKELYDLYKWGELHQHYKMTIPASYFGHKDFLDKGLLKEFYSLELADNANKWVDQDIIKNYGTDYRVHIVRVTMKTVELVQNACIRQGVVFRNHTSTDRLSADQINEFFKEPLKQHIVLGVKGFFRRANLIPNRWKLRIGATHEYYTPNVDYNVQIQGLTGRMTGYWRDIIEKGHKTGPHRTSIKAVEAYEKTYIDHLGFNSYKTAGFTMKNGVVHKEDTIFSETNVGNLEAKELPIIRQKGQMPIVVINISDEEKSKFNKKCIFDLINKYDQEVVTSYKKYKLHLWNIDDASKEEKYGLLSMLRPNAFSGLTNIREKDKTKQVLMIYLHENKLIISAWNGEEFKAYQ